MNEKMLLTTMLWAMKGAADQREEKGVGDPALLGEEELRLKKPSVGQSRERGWGWKRLQ